MVDLTGWQVVGGARSYGGNAPFSQAAVVLGREDGRGVRPYAKCALDFDRGYLPIAFTAREWETFVQSGHGLKFVRHIKAEEWLYIVVVRPTFPNGDLFIADLLKSGVAHMEEDEATRAHALVVRHPAATEVIERVANEMRLATYAALQQGSDACSFAQTFMCMEVSPGVEAFALRAIALDRAGRMSEMQNLLQVACNSGKHEFYEKVVIRYGELKRLYS